MPATNAAARLQIYRLLRRYGVALCLADSARYPRHAVLTTDFAYYRLHGRPELFSSPYSEADLERVSDDLPAPDAVTEQNGVPIARWDWDPTVVPVIARGRVVVAGPYRFNLDMGDDPHAFISALLAATETARNNPPEQ